MRMNTPYDLAVDRQVLHDLYHPIGLSLSMIGDGKHVLELGCATGYITRLLTQEYHCRVTGVEYMPEAAEQARPYCAKLVIGDVESEAVLQHLDGLYDVILAGDVLEHLRYPDRLLTRLRSALRPSGYWVISVPNIAHWSARKELLLGRFNFTARGIMDASHLRWFTIHTLTEMLHRTGYAVMRLEAVYTVPWQDRLRLRSLARRLQRAKIAPGLFGYQLVVQAKPA